MAGAEEICAALAERSFSAIGLVLNERGLERALECDLDEINCVAYAADGYAQKNTGASAKERNKEAAGLVKRAAGAGKRTSVTISVAFGDPVDGEVDEFAVGAIVEQMAKAGADEIAFGDTIGVADPHAVTRLLVHSRRAAPGVALRCHFHNTRNTGYANAFAALEAGVNALDAAVGGYGGSPFSPGAGGNVASEALAWMLGRMGVETGLDAMELAATGVWLARELGEDAPPAMLGRTSGWPAGA
jgi:hydroxymethylglutaryl-CoA lyase